MKRFVALAAATIFVFGMTGFPVAEETANIYTGTGTGRNGDIVVEVKIDGDVIEDVSISSQQETAGIADAAIENLPKIIVDAQSADVDVVSGATLTSNGIIEAVKDAISKSGAEPEAFTAQAVEYEKALTPGTYTATAHGHHSDITVEVKFSEDTIDEITVTECGDNMHISDVAVDRLPSAIVENQSIAVDAVTGATFTSRGILSAVEDAILQAGGDPMAFRTTVPKAERGTEQFEESYDVVVVGSGLAGTTAALAAQQKGASVLILEKLPYYGGISQTSAGAFKYATTVDDDGESQYYKYLMQKSVGLMQEDESKQNGYPDEASVRVLIDQAPVVAEWYMENGVGLINNEMSDDINNRYTMGFYMFYDGEHFEPDNCAAAIEVLVNRFTDDGGKLYLETPAVSLIEEDGSVTGVKAEGPLGDYTIHAKSVVLACGGFGSDPEMIAELAPAYAGETVGGTGIGNTGDGIRMAREVGAAVYDDAYLMGGSGQTFITDADRIKPFADAETPKASMDVNPLGQRVNSESPISYTPAITYVNPDATDYYWAIMNEEIAHTPTYSDAYYMDEDHALCEYMEYINAALEEGSPNVFKADTLEQLAKEINIVPTTLMYTMAHYNRLCEQGEDTDLGKSANYMIPMYDGPWYAVKADMEFFGTVGGVVSDETGAVLKDDGTEIPGLYAAGETSNHKVLNMSYSGGVSVAENAVYGKVSGESAADFALNE